MKKCENCHHEIKNEMQYCLNCGQKMNKDYQAELHEAMDELFSKPKKMNHQLTIFLSVIIGIIVIMFLCGCLIFFLFSSYKTQNLEQIKPVEKEEVIPEKPQIEETDNDSIHFSANYSNGVHVSKIEAEKVEGKIKIIIYYQSDHEVKVSMNDYKGNHIIGPIHIGKGNSFYFLIEKIMEENVIIEISDQSNKNIITIPKEEILKDIGAAD